MKKLLALLLMLPLVANAVQTYEFDWEVTAPTAANVRNYDDGYWFHGNCFAIAAGDVFDSIQLSTKYARMGSKSIRMFNDGRFSNSQGHNNCPSFVKAETTKHRNEIRYGDGKGIGTFQNWPMGAERWFRFSMYVPSDEGNYSQWNAETAPTLAMIAQWIGTDESTDLGHEIAMLIAPGPSIFVEGVYGTTATQGTEYPHPLGKFNIKKDAWNDFVIRHRRSWQTAAENPTGYGIIQIWANCVDWADCDPVIDYSGRAAIRSMITGWHKNGPYAYAKLYDRQIALYYDAIKMAIRDSETDAQMLAEMADVFDSKGGGSTGGGGGTVVASDLEVNAGAAIDSLQDPINFTVTGANDVIGCQMNRGAFLPAKWNYTTATGGKFAGVDTTGFASTGTVTCYDEPFINNPDMGTITLTAANVTITKRTDLDIWGYARGQQIVKTGTATNVEGNWSYGAAYNAVPGDKIRFDFTYSCTSTSCNNLYFDVSHATGTDKRIRAAGTAGSLALTAISGVAQHGTDIAITNMTLPDDAYRVTIAFTASEANTYRIRAGWSNSAPPNVTLYFVEAVMRKNWTTKILTDEVAYSVADTQEPTLSGCAMSSLVRVIDPDTSATSYTTNLTCTADEIGGTDYAMITTSDTAPNVAAVQAGTGAIWSSQKSADTTEIAFEASGMSYQDLWGWIVRCDAQDNCSAVQGASFDDGVGPDQQKKIMFVSQVLRRAGVPFTGTVQRLAVWTASPLTTLRQTELFTLEDVSFTSGNFASGSLSGDEVNALQAGVTYVLTAADSDNDPYWVVPFQITIE